MFQNLKVVVAFLQFLFFTIDNVKSISFCLIQLPFYVKLEISLIKFKNN